jgi:hypothetical protein
MMINDCFRFMYLLCYTFNVYFRVYSFYLHTHTKTYYRAVCTLSVANS